jgi:riboflavin biosynthesis pyrimidine reductase
MPLAGIREQLARPVYVAAGAAAAGRLRPALEGLDIKLIIAGHGSSVDGRELIRQLAAAAYSSIYSIAGPQVLKTLLEAGVLNRLYITRVHRLLGGSAYNTMLEDDLPGPVDLALRELYYDANAVDGASQIIGVYDVSKTGINPEF